MPDEFVQEQFQTKPKCQIAEKQGSENAPDGPEKNDRGLYPAFGRA
jgi:hypothetical protein